MVGGLNMVEVSWISHDSAPAVTSLASTLMRVNDLRELDISHKSCAEQTGTELGSVVAQQPIRMKLIMTSRRRR